jgi:separase
MAAAAPTGPAGGALVVVFDAALQALPWESLPGLAGQRLYRLPALPCAAAAQLGRRAAQQARRDGPSGGAPPGAPAEPAAAAAVQVDLSSAFYALNPSGDLTATQAAFEEWFRRLEGWEGRAGAAPSASELAAALQARRLFVYFGHGGGEQYLAPPRLRALPRCAAALLMGCSSGRLRPRALYEPAGVVLAYLLAGCPAAVANLWDVTDRDIDRFSQEVLTRWLSGAGGGGGGDFAAAVAQGRAACKLPHLIGAAPVVYGVPAEARLPAAAAATARP